MNGFDENHRSFLFGLGVLVSSRSCCETSPELSSHRRKGKDMCSPPPKANILFIFVTTGMSISNSVRPQDLKIWRWGASKSWPVPGFRSTAISTWTKPFMF